MTGVQTCALPIFGLHRPASGAFRHIVFASIRKCYPQQARKVVNALWGLDRLATAKLIVVVDQDVDVRDADAVWFAVASHCHAGRDTLFSDGPADMLDHAAPIRGIGSRLGIDATRKSPDEGHPRDWPAAQEFDKLRLSQLEARWPILGLPFSLSARPT